MNKMVGYVARLGALAGLVGLVACGTTHDDERIARRVDAGLRYEFSLTNTPAWATRDMPLYFFDSDLNGRPDVYAFDRNRNGKADLDELYSDSNEDLRLEGPSEPARASVSDEEMLRELVKHNVSMAKRLESLDTELKALVKR